MKKSSYYSPSLKTSTLTRSRTYIVVPRDVPPENFISVNETRKVRKVGFFRCCLPPLLLVILISCLLAGIGFLVYRYKSTGEENVTATWPLPADQGADQGGDGYHRREGQQHQGRGGEGEHHRWGLDKGGKSRDQGGQSSSTLFKSLENSGVSEQHQSRSRSKSDSNHVCPVGYWGQKTDGCQPCLCSDLGSLDTACEGATGQCRCKEGFTGHKCNICPNGSVQKYGGGCDEGVQSISAEGTPCSSSPCEGGGSCEEHDGTFTCYCTHDRSGKYCEKEISKTDLKVAGFRGNSYVELKPLHKSLTRTSLEMSFRTFAKDGLLFHTETGPNEFISLRIDNGHLRFEYSTGASGAVSLESPVQVNLGHWHTVRAQRYHQDGMLMLDELEPVTGQAPGHGKTIKISKNSYIGWRPGLEIPGFQGCIKTFEFGHNPVSLVSGREPMLFKSEDIQDCYDHVCDTMPCQNSGECKTSKVGFTCTCPPGFLGSRCDISRTPCDPNPCQAGAVCTSRDGQVECACPPDRQGLLCQHLIPLGSSPAGPGYQADQADLEGMPSLPGDLLVLPGKKLYEYKANSSSLNRMDFSFSFLTNKASGTLLYSGEVDDNLEVAMVAGHLVFRAHHLAAAHSGGSRGIAVSRDRVDDGKWHTALLRRSSSKLYCRLDDKEVFTGEMTDTSSTNKNNMEISDVTSTLQNNNINNKNKDSSDDLNAGADMRHHNSKEISVWIGGRDPYPEELNQNIFTGHVKSLRINQSPVDNHAVRVHVNISMDS